MGDNMRIVMLPVLLLLLLLLLSHRGVCSSCQPPFTITNSHCVFIDESEQLSWCEAAEKCLEMGGELVTRIDTIRAVRSSLSSTYGVWIGVADLLIERGTNRIGWQVTDGREFPTLDNVDWEIDKPNGNIVSDDFLEIGSDGLNDVRFEYERALLCQPIATPSSHVFARTDFLQLGSISPSFCHSDAPADHLLLCLGLCARRWQCRAALHNSVLRQCRMLDFTDASVGDEIEKNPNWTKFVKKLY